MNQSVGDSRPRQICQQDAEGNGNHQQRFVFFMNAQVQQYEGNDDHDQIARVFQKTGET